MLKRILNRILKIKDWQILSILVVFVVFMYGRGYYPKSIFHHGSMITLYFLYVPILFLLSILLQNSDRHQILKTFAWGLTGFMLFETFDQIHTRLYEQVATSNDYIAIIGAAIFIIFSIYQYNKKSS